MTLPNDTPVDTPRVGPEGIWEAQALALKNDGYNASVVARKMVTMHGMPEHDAEALVGRLFGKKVSARTGDTTSAVIGGLVVAGLAIAGAVLFYTLTGGHHWGSGTALVYAALLSVITASLRKVFMALMNANAKEPL